ncbi:hypothetical protein LCGC14_2488970, partial [marine sediment metagenome]
VLEFGRKVDLLTFEIESVNLEALKQLEKEGLEVKALIEFDVLKSLLFRKGIISEKEFNENVKKGIGYVNNMPIMKRLKEYCKQRIGGK